MDGTTLREVQAPLKARYRDEPSSALTSLQATGAFGDPDITCSLAEPPSISIRRKATPE